MTQLTALLEVLTDDKDEALTFLPEEEVAFDDEALTFLPEEEVAFDDEALKFWFNEEAAFVVLESACFKDWMFAGSSLKLARIGWHDGVDDLLKNNKIVVDCNQNNRVV